MSVHVPAISLVSYSQPLIFINSSLEVIEVYFDARPFSEKSIISEKRAKFVLELNAGVFKEQGFEIGDKIIF